VAAAAGQCVLDKGKVERQPGERDASASFLSSLSHPVPLSHPIVVMKLDVNWSSAKRSRRQDLPTP
jgi:hypothetical protein